jgi:hypothetical protein
MPVSFQAARRHKQVMPVPKKSPSIPVADRDFAACPIERFAWRVSGQLGGWSAPQVSAPIEPRAFCL